MSSPRKSGLRRSSLRTPRTSIGDDAGGTAIETPYTNLRQLAGLIRKPSTAPRVRSGGDLVSDPVPPRRTPSGEGRTTGASDATRQVPVRRRTPTTPHTIRALQKRRAAALAAGKSHRRSGRQQKETPRETLRQLSKILARDTQPIEPSPLVEGPRSGGHTVAYDEDDLEDGPELIRPRLSLPLDDDDDEDSLTLPPQDVAEHVDEENLTRNSVELPREYTGIRRSRASVGSIRTSDRFADFNNLEEEQSGDEEEDDVQLPGPELDRIDYDDEDAEGEEIELGEDMDTRELQRAYSEESSRRQSDVISDLRPDDIDEPTFALEIPQRMENTSHLSDVSIQQQHSQPLADESLLTAPEAQKYSSPPKEPETAGLEPQSQQQNQLMEEGVGLISQDSKPKPKPCKVLKQSRHGIPYPSLPVGVVKKLATRFARSSGGGKSQLSRETLEAVMEASDWFFEQVSEDLGAYARHAGRKTIDESDMITLMKRQRQINATTTPFSLAQRYLPRELLQEIRMTPLQRPQRKRKQKLEAVEEADEEG